MKLRRESVPKNGGKNDSLAAYIRHFAEAELPAELREDGICEAWVCILETVPGVDIRRVAAVSEQTHADLVRDIVKYLRLTGWLVLVTPRGGIQGAPGWSDLIAFKARRVLFVEAKVGRDELKPDQVRIKGELEARGFEVLEARDLDSVIAATS